MRDLGVRFLGTVKNSLKFPFYFVEVNESGKSCINQRAVVQLHGMRNSWTATSRNPKKKHDVIQASAFRHGQGKARAARLCTSIPEAMKSNEFVYETDSYKITRVPHGAAPAPLKDGATTAEKIRHAIEISHLMNFRMTRG